MWLNHRATCGYFCERQERRGDETGGRGPTSHAAGPSPGRTSPSTAPLKNLEVASNATTSATLAEKPEMYERVARYALNFSKSEPKAVMICLFGLLESCEGAVCEVLGRSICARARILGVLGGVQVQDLSGVQSRTGDRVCMRSPTQP